MKRFLVTGGAGFIGSHIADRLLKMGNDVWIVDNLSTGARRNVAKGATFVDLDIADEQGLDSLARVEFEAAFHMAAQTSGEISHEKPAYDLLTNALGTLNLLRWCLKRGVERFLYASSMGVYGLKDKFPVSENDECHPYSFYGISKLAGEHYVDHFRTKGMKTTIFRMFNVYGPGQDLANLKQGMVSIYLSYLLKGKPVVVKGSKDRFRDFIYVDDVVEAWIATLDNPMTFGKTYNLALGTRTYVWQLIEQLLNAFGYNPETYPVHYAEGTPGDQFGMWADISKIMSDLGWQPRVSLSDGLRRMVDWAQSVQTGTRG